MPAAKRSADRSIYIATESGSAQVGGDYLTFVKGVTRVRAGHPLLKQAPQYFELDDQNVHYEVEHDAAKDTETR